jgi:outer membrane protein assembly factor BamB
MKPLSAFDPTTIASYRLLGVLGSGGMGRVYLAQSRSGRPVAIKVIRADLVDDPASRRRFAREVAAARTISPLFTAAVVDADTEAESPWLATTYIDGPSLEQWVDHNGALGPRPVLTLAAGLAEALASFHRAGLVHRDLKPSNVLLSDTGPHVIDFGLVLSPHGTRISMGRPVGTPSYMAPECIHGAEAGPPADIFSLGATLVFATTGHSLVESEAVYAQIMQITQGRFELSEVPAELRPLVARCLSLEPTHRPTAGELVSVLAADGIPAPEPGWYQAVSTTPIGMVLDLPPPPAQPSRRRLLVAGAVAGVAVLGGVGAWFGTRGRDGTRDPVAGATAPPGTVLWQAKSGARPAGAAGAARIIPDPTGRVVAVNASEIYAQTAAGRRLWTRALPAQFVDAHAWQDAVLVAATSRLWLLDAASGEQRFAVDVAGGIRGVVPSGEHAFLAVASAAAAVDGQGRTRWRQPAGSPLAADSRWLLTHDRADDTVQVGLHDAGSGTRRWTVKYPVTTRPKGGPPGRDGGPPSGGPPGGGGGSSGGPVGGGPPGDPRGGPPGDPRGYDDAWARAEAMIGAELVVVRDGQEVRALRLSDGGTAWQKPWPTPIAAITVAGDLLLVGADQLYALRLATGEQVWRSPLSGARTAVTADGQALVVAAERTVSSLDLAGTIRWQTDLPAASPGVTTDQVIVDGPIALITFRPMNQQLPPPNIDVIAVALRA